MLFRPWATPELTSVGRLPMHSVVHTDRIALDGRWRFQLLHTPEQETAAQWSKVDVPGCWTMQGFFDRPHYTNVQMPFPGNPPQLPEVNPTGVYERDFDLPAGVGRRAPRRPPRRGRRECPDRFRQRAAGRHQQGLAPGGRVRRHEHRPAGGQLHHPARGEVVRRHLHRGSGRVVARRDHSLGVPLRHAARPSSRRAGQRRPGGRSSDRNVRAAGRRRSRRRRPGKRLDGRGDAGRSRAPRRGRAVRRRRAGRRRQPRRLGAAEPSSLRHGGEARVGRPGRGRKGPVGGARAGAAPAARRPSDDPNRDRRRPAMVRRAAAPLPAARRPAVALGRGGRGGGPAGRLPAGRGRGPPPAHQRRRRAHSRREPPRLRSAHRAPRIARVDAGGPRGDEAVRLQRRPDVPLSQRPGVPGSHRRARPVRRRRGRHRVARLHRRHLRRPALPQRLRGPRRSHGPPRQEPRFGDPVVARKRVRPRCQPGRRGGLHPPLRSEPADPLRGRDPVGLVERPEGQRRHLPDVSAHLRHRRPRRIGPAAPPADHVRVLACHGQQQRHAGRVLGRDRGHGRPPGWIHLGVVGPRPGPTAARRHDSLGLRRRLRRRAQ